MITVIIPYTGNQPALASLLVMLQPQLHPDDDIYIVDQSEYGSARHVVERYGSTRCYIFVEPVKEMTIGPDDMQRGLQSMRENKQSGALVIFPGCIISTTLVPNLKKAIKNHNYDLFVFNITHHVENRIDANFEWYTPPPVVQKAKDVWSIIEAEILFIRASVVNDKLEVSLPESDDIRDHVGFISSETVAHFSP